MKEISFYNGEFLDYDRAKTSVEDRGNTFGDGVYDALSAFNGIPLNLDRHVDRFFVSMSEIDIHSPYTKDEVKDIIKRALEKLESPQTMVYFQTTRGTEKRSHVFSDDMTGNFYLSARVKPTYANERKNGACLISLPDDRWRRCDIKSLNLLANVLAAKKASEQGCIEALLVRDGNAAECTASSFYIIKDGMVFTEPLSPLILKGVTRSCLSEIIMPKAGVKLIEKHLSLSEVYEADEAFITSCSKMILPVTKIDNQKIGNAHPVADRLFDAYVAFAEEQCGSIIKENI